MFMFFVVVNEHLFHVFCVSAHILGPLWLLFSS